ncbi:MAG TPA: hypothetical protein VFQ44_00325 [Streptosporangiaceae bacterium]|nr:hypothetical protein [Streptosporangiaceae bacterium]
MRKILAAGGAVSIILGVVACGGHHSVSGAGGNGRITQSAVAPLGAHFSGSVTADQFACWDQQVSPPGTPGTASGNVSVYEWELSHLGGKLSGWLVRDIRSVQGHGNRDQHIERLYSDCKSRVPVPAGWNLEGPKRPG